jgi:iron only hydrogenase large subunit-like protein
MEFSGTVKITDLNDFLRPSEKCSVHNSMIKTSSNNTAKVSLSDCLACSGCITSAESVLLETHSLATLQEKLLQNEIITISISQQSLLSISDNFSMNVDIVFNKLSQILRKKGVNQVVDMCHARDVVLECCYQEFRMKFQSGNIPILSSECPGWLCYALKKGDSKLVNLMSTQKTPMLVQKDVRNILGCHVAVMPCFDKKLESFMEQGVELVLTTTELLEFCQGFELEECDEVQNNFYSTTKIKSSSMGYAEYIFTRAVKDIYGEDIEIEPKSTRRRDVYEIEFRDLKFCIASGFQNIQNIIRDLKTKKSTYSYIEIMACPMGCLNGGGQLRTTREKTLELESSTRNFYRLSDIKTELPSIERELKLVQGNNLKW